MDIQNKLRIDLKERLAYGESIILTRDELFLLIDGDLGYMAELEEEIEELSEELDQARESCECKNLQEKLDKISKIIES